jgi:hypothetical protein
MADEIADDFDPLGIVIRNLHAIEFIFDQYRQLKTIEPVGAQTQIVGNENSYFA